jgi:hypothetical protein
MVSKFATISKAEYILKLSPYREVRAYFLQAAAGSLGRCGPDYLRAMAAPEPI